jgi:hypothetical protein
MKIDLIKQQNNLITNQQSTKLHSMACTQLLRRDQPEWQMQGKREVGGGRDEVQEICNEQ